MALKGDREIYRDSVRYTCESVASRGVGLVVKTAGSGVVLGDSRPLADLVANPSGYVFAGILLNDVVSTDETLYHRNFHKDETKTTEPCRLLKCGLVVTDKLKSGDAPTDGDTAYLTANGEFTKTSLGAIATPAAGQFRGKKDADGFIAIEINIP